jgi:SHS2 domain-containing protein
MKAYEFIDHTADIALQLKGSSLEELFAAAALGLREAVIEKGEVEGNEEKSIELKEGSLEELLVRFVDELNYLISSSKWLFTEIKFIEILNGEDHYELKVLLAGDSFSDKNIELRVEIKAVTFHQLDLILEEGVYSTKLVFDI